MDDELRFSVKLIKAKQGISYKEIASYIEIKASSFYNWLREQYNLSEEKREMLKDVINNLSE